MLPTFFSMKSIGVDQYYNYDERGSRVLLVVGIYIDADLITAQNL
jgi:hypothetical protein